VAEGCQKGIQDKETRCQAEQGRENSQQQEQT
jgi:hypothetical protein